VVSVTALEERILPSIISTGIALDKRINGNLCLQMNLLSRKHVVSLESRSANESIEIYLKCRGSGTWGAT
jgi:hypothetical protein